MSLSLKKGDMFSGCEILSFCGSGAFGSTYLAKNPIGKKIIIKIIASDRYCASELKGLKNYMQVAETNLNLLQIFHIGDFENGFFYTMEAADNCSENNEYLPATLGNLLRQGKIFTPEEAFAITRDLLECIKIMHNANLLHRDIKPDNIIFVNGKAKLSDPGLVIAEGEYATFAGTLGFIPPERIKKELPSDKGSDLYAIGKVFYCMVTGNSPKAYPEFPMDMSLSIRRQLFPVLVKMCHSSPAKRFQSADDFLKNMPERINKPTRFEKMLIDFHDWKILNIEKFHALMIFIFMLIFLAAAGTGYLFFHQNMESKRIDRLQKKIDTFLAINNDRKELLDFQLEVYLPELLPKYRTLSKAIEQKKKSALYDDAFEVCNKLKNHLRQAAEKLLPPITQKTDNFQHNFSVAGSARSFLATPLSQYLDPDHKKKYISDLTAHEKKLYSAWNGPKCQGTWGNFQNYSRELVFVPSGAFKMAHNQKNIKIPYHFWIGKNEVTHDFFAHMTGISPQYSPHSNTPVERVSWNDALFYCCIINNLMKSQGLLPPGYIVRMPTEAEWEYAANNAWLGKDTVPFLERAVIKNNSGSRSYPPGSKKTNLLGINDIYGNVYEMVLPIEKNIAANTVTIRGGSYLTSEKSCFKRIEFLAYQTIPYDIGFRFVVGPGDESYYDKHFFLGEANQTRIRGKVYELVGSNYRCLTWQKANMLAQLLGGRLAEFEDAEHLQQVIKKIPLITSKWPCFLGGQKINGKWKWIHSNKDINFGRWIKNKQDNKNHNYLTIRDKSWKAENNAKASIFLCEWDEKDYPKRNEQLKNGEKLPGELMRFAIADRQFMLIDNPVMWIGARRFCELLGGRIACLDTPELRKQIISKVQKYKNFRIMLGGYAKRDKWYWLSGKEIDFIPEKDRRMPIPSANCNYVTLRNGKFYNSQYGDLLLCEWSNNLLSSN